MPCWLLGVKYAVFYLGSRPAGNCGVIKANGKTVPFRRILIGRTEKSYSIIATNGISAVHLTREYEQSEAAGSLAKPAEKCDQKPASTGEFCLEYATVRDLFGAKDKVIEFKIEDTVDELAARTFNESGELVKSCRILNYKNSFPSLGQLDKLFEEAAIGEGGGEVYLNYTSVKNMMAGISRIYKSKDSVLIKLNGKERPAYFCKTGTDSTFEGITGYVLGD